MPDWLEQIYHLVQPWLPLLVSLSIAMLLVSFLLLPAICILLPADYFVTQKRLITQPLPRTLWWAVRNVLALIMLILGVLMLFLPGQGLLTLLAALLIADFPGKRKLEIHLVKRPAIYKSINWVRRKANKPLLLHPSDKPS